MKNKIIVVCSIALLFFCGCKAVYTVERVAPNELQKEGSIVFTRPVRFSLWAGSYSLNEFIEITYERTSRNDAGFLVVEVGIRYRGPVRWTNWYKTAPEKLPLRMVCHFYQDAGSASSAVYSTNHREIVISRGETFAFKAVCPVITANNYKLVLGD